MKPVLFAWLDLVCQMLPNVQHALLRLDATEPSELAWPADTSPPESLHSAAGLALSQGSPVFSSGEPYALVAYPVELEDGARAALALSLSVTSSQQAAILQLLGWSQSWLRLLLRQANSIKNAPGSASNSVASAGAGLADGVDWLWEDIAVAPDVETLGVSLTTRLANQAGSQRVWLGAGPADRLAVVAVSNQSSFDARVNLVGMVEEAMLECLEQGEALLWNGNQDLPAHAALAREAHASALVSVPVMHAAAAEGVLLFEQHEGTGWTGTDSVNGDTVARQLGPILSLQRQLKPNRLGRLEIFLSAGIARLLGPGSLALKGICAVILLVLLLLVFGEGQHQVKSDAFVEGLEQQSIAAPFDGFIASAEVRAGESVSMGQELARMEDKDILLDLQQVQGEREALEREYRQALAAVEQARTRILQARISQVMARQALLENRLAQVSLRTPIDGVVISGDLSRAQGSPVEKGALLFQVAPQDRYRVVLRISERSVDEVTAGGSGELLLAAHPGNPIPFVITNISSVFDSDSEEGVRFRAEGALEGEYNFLRPGMEGVARVDVGTRSLAWIYLHDLVDWFRLLLWRWLP